MNSLNTSINHGADAAISFAVVLLALDVLLRNRIRAGFRYMLWMLLLVKLVLPPTLAEARATRANRRARATAHRADDGNLGAVRENTAPQSSRSTLGLTETRVRSRCHR